MSNNANHLKVEVYSIIKCGIGYNNNIWGGEMYEKHSFVIVNIIETNDKKT